MTGVALIAVSAACFGAIAVLAKIAYEHGAEPTGVLVPRFAIAAACLIVLVRVKRMPLPSGRTLVAFAVLGGAGYVGQSLSFFTAAQLIPAGLVALLLYIYPAIVTVASVFLYGERLGRAKILALVLALTGTALTVAEAGEVRALGVALGLLSALCYSAYILISARYAPRAGAVPASTVVITAAALTYGVIALISKPAFPTDATGWAAVAALAIIGTVFAFITFLAGLERVGPADASTLSTLEPVTTVILAAALLGERIRPIQLVGGALILAGVIVLTRSGREVAPVDAPATSGS